MHTRLLLICFIVRLFIPLSYAFALSESEIDELSLKSIVRICKPNLGCGTGAVLDDGRILTALHVVSEGCWSGYCDLYNISIAQKIGEEANTALEVEELVVDEILPGLDAAILRPQGATLAAGVFSLEKVASLSEEELYTLDFANNRALRFSAGRVVQDRVTFATTTIAGGKGSSGAPIFTKDFKLAGIRVSAASWRDAIRGLALPISQGAITPAAMLQRTLHSNDRALTIARGLNEHHKILMQCKPSDCSTERGFFIGHVVEFTFFLGELSQDFNRIRPGWYSIFSFLNRPAPSDELGEELELLSLAYEIELHLGPMPRGEKEVVLDRLRALLQENPRSEAQMSKLMFLLDYAEKNTWSHRPSKRPGLLEQIVPALWLPLLVIGLAMFGLGFILASYRRKVSGTSTGKDKTSV